LFTKIDWKIINFITSEFFVLIGTKFFIFGGSRLIDKMRNEAARFEMDMIEKEFFYLEGRVRAKAKKAYFKLLKSCVNKLELEKPIYLMRSE
jgi:hypothetical protein